MAPLVMDVFWLFYFNRIHHSRLHGTEFADDLAIITKLLRTVQTNSKELQPLSIRQLKMVDWWNRTVQSFLDFNDKLGEDHNIWDELGTTEDALLEANEILSSKNWIGD